MKISLSQLRKIIKEEVASVVQGPLQQDRFLHGEESGGQTFDDEAEMVKSQLVLMKDMAEEVCDLLNSGDQLPAWAQSHVAVAHENLRQVHGYLVGDSVMDAHEAESQRGLSESHSRITSKELAEWQSGNWGFVSESDEDDLLDS
jgi:hypothetical protein